LVLSFPAPRSKLSNRFCSYEYFPIKSFCSFGDNSLPLYFFKGDNPGDEYKLLLYACFFASFFGLFWLGETVFFEIPNDSIVLDTFYLNVKLLYLVFPGSTFDFA
jgi:hypothetical protein